jgi:Xaa-Pro aminopeptidase
VWDRQYELNKPASRKAFKRVFPKNSYKKIALEARRIMINIKYEI